MKLLFISNYLNHHQKFVSDTLNECCEDYRFIVTSEISDMRRKLGYSEVEEPYACKVQDMDDRVLHNTDVVVIGAAPRSIIKPVKRDKLIFYYAERPLKQKLTFPKFVYRFFRWRLDNIGAKRLYMLCASAYTAADFAKFGLYRKTSYKWGYFPETKHYDIDSLLCEKSPVDILWCGRFLDWKHPDDAVRAAKLLKDDGYSFRLTVIGNGEMNEELLSLTKELELSDCVSVLGSLPPEQVRARMEKSGIFLFTSDRKEGWGAVLNEAMNSGCAVVASHIAGSTPSLVTDRENGLIYRSGDVDSLYRRIKYLLDDPGEQKRMGRAAYYSIVDLWNAETAAKRLVALSQAILNGQSSPDIFSSGPCSRAEVLSNDWFKEENISG